MIYTTKLSYSTNISKYFMLIKIKTTHIDFFSLNWGF